MDIVALLQCLEPEMRATTLRHFSLIACALLAISGRITMRGLARWTGQGGSYRTVQRFFYTVLPWEKLFWLFFRTHLHHPEAVYLLAGDEVVVTKAGKQSYGLDRFFSSLYGKPVSGLAFFTLALVSVQERRSYPLRIEQVVRTPGKATSKGASEQPLSASPAQPRRPGRPLGSKNKNKADQPLSAELLHIKAMLEGLLARTGSVLPLTYLLLDGHFGNNHALQMTRQCNLHLISKLRTDAVLYLPYVGPYAGRGRRRTYGSRVDYRHLPLHLLKATTQEGPIQTQTYQFQALHKAFCQPLNVVIIVKTNRQTQTQAHVILFSSDLTLPYDQLIDYYGLRFQIEFNFRDAKQFWGLEDFMNVTQTAITNAANLALFMVNLSYRLLGDFRMLDPQASVLDLKAHYRGFRYVVETIKLLPDPPEPILLTRIFNHVAALGRIHLHQAGLSPT